MKIKKRYTGTRRKVENFGIVQNSFVNTRRRSKNSYTRTGENLKNTTDVEKAGKYDDSININQGA